MILTVKTRSRTELIDITSDVSQLVRKSGIEAGLCLLYVPHTTAAVTIMKVPIQVLNPTS